MGKIEKVKMYVAAQPQKKPTTVAVSKKKKNALIICSDEGRFWVTQKEFWNWFREKKITKINDHPLTGKFIRSDDEKIVILANTVLNLSCPRHLSEVLNQRKLRRT